MKTDQTKVLDISNWNFDLRAVKAKFTNEHGETEEAIYTEKGLEAKLLSWLMPKKNSEN